MVVLLISSVKVEFLPWRLTQIILIEGFLFVVGQFLHVISDADKELVNIQARHLQLFQQYRHVRTVLHTFTIFRCHTGLSGKCHEESFRLA